jgi:Cu/Ag efflux pump CusA
VGFLFKEQKIYDVVVQGSPEARQSPDKLRDLWIEKSDRTYTRLGEVASVKTQSSPTVIRHERISPYVDVVANVSGRDIAAAVDEIEDRLEKIKFPLEYHPELISEYSERLAVQRRMTGVTLACLAGIFLLLQVRLGSWRLAVLALLVFPASIAGGVLAALLGGAVMSLGSLIGFLAGLAVAARNGTLLIDDYQRLHGSPGEAFTAAMAVQAARERLTAMLASSGAVVAALLPLVIVGPVPGLEIVQPMAIVMIGSVIGSMAFTLFVVPPLYLTYGASAQREDLRLEAA